MSLPTAAIWPRPASRTRNRSPCEARLARNKLSPKPRSPWPNSPSRKATPRNAESALHQCKEQFHSEQQSDDELAASVVLTRALLAEGKPADARHEVEASELLAKKSQNRLAQLQFALASARVVVSSDKPESARAELERILKDARAHGFVGLEFEVRLALAELEERSGRSAAAQAQLLSLERTARIKGFGLIARKAAADRTRDLGVGEKSADHGHG